ncbi:MAG: MBOAT family protein [Bacteroidetes bacterium]|nr:MBOAT family protein [Bacteroidota bacterium]
MVFSSIVFLFYFFPIWLLTYALSPERFRNWVLLIFSLVFYAWGAPRFIFILIASTVADYYIVNQIYKEGNTRRKKRWLLLSIALNLGLLLWFKYANFFAENLNSFLMNLGMSGYHWMEIILPIGISFYTFQTLTYSIDVYRGTHKPLRNVRDYVLYIIMFPQLIAGPIVRFHEIADELVNRVFSRKNIIEGFNRFCRGLAKKVLIANTLGAEVDEVLRGNLAELNSVSAWIAILLYTFQIYFDFSGYSDMAIGLGRMMGFRFPENFNQPYRSFSITEFWRRWHITLGNFMRDYLYVPLGGNRNSKFSTYRNLGIVFLLSGFWHGANWNFILWGVWHGSFLIIERLTGLNKTERLKIVRIPLTFLIVVLGWVVFRIEESDRWAMFYSKLFAFEPGWDLALFNAKTMTVAIVAILLSFLPQRIIPPKLFETESGMVIRFIVSVCFFVFSTASLSSGSFNPFIYFRF